MRIISEYKDYYDHMQGADQDKETVFVRKRSELWADNLNILSGSLGLYGSRYVGFCGKIYPYKIYRKYDKNGRFHIEEYWEGFDEKPEYDSRRNSWYRLNTDESWYQKDYAYLFDKFGPIFLLDGCRRNNSNKWDTFVVINPNINKEIPGRFQKIIPPPQAYQLLTQYIYNSANKGRPIPEMDNDTKISLAGFDENSFRNTKPGGPRRKRK